MKAQTIFLVLTLICGFVRTSVAQNEAVDVLYLKNGSIIRGTIIELVPDASVKIRTSDGSVFVFRMDDVERIDKAEAVLPRSIQPRIPDYNPYTIHKQVAGIGLASVMVSTMAGSLAMGDEYFATTIAPIVGPWITMIRIESDPGSRYLPGGKPLLIASGIAQGGLLIYYLVSLFNEKAYNRQTALHISPSSNGLSLSYRF